MTKKQYSFHFDLLFKAGQQINQKKTKLWTETAQEPSIYVTDELVSLRVRGLSH